MRRLGALGLAFALLVAACGNDDDAGSDEVINPEDQSIADAAVLQLSDFDDGWRQDPVDEDEGDDAFDDVDECSEIAEVFADSPDVASAETTFSLSAGTAEVESSVGILPTVSQANQVLELFTDDRVITCMQALFDQVMQQGLEEDPEFAEGVDDIEVTVGRIAAPSQGDASAALQAEVSISAEGLRLPVFFDMVVVQVDRGVGLFFFTDTFTPLTDTDRYVAAVADRLSAELAA